MMKHITFYNSIQEYIVDSIQSPVIGMFITSYNKL